MLGDQGFQLADQVGVPTRVEVGGDASLQGADPQLGEPGGLGSEHAVRLDVGVGVAPPQRQGLAQCFGGSLRLQGAGRLVKVLEANGIDRIPVDVEGPPGAPLGDHVADYRAEGGHIGLHPAAAPWRSILAVDRLSDQVGAHRPTGVCDEHRQDGSAAWALPASTVRALQ